MWDTLEARILMSRGSGTGTPGNTLLAISGVTATLTGDEKYNSIQITPAPGGYLVTPIRLSTLNGSTSPVFVPATVQNFNVNLAGGIDQFYAYDLTFGALTLNMGGGDDEVSLNRLNASAINVNTAAGNDGVIFSLLNVNGVGIDLDTGDGNDYASIDRVTVQGHFFAQMGGGSDRFAPTNLTPGAPGLTVNGGPVRIDGGANKDILELQGSIVSDTPPTIIGFETILGPTP
jgi:hypothetical protein